MNKFFKLLYIDNSISQDWYKNAKKLIQATIEELLTVQVLSCNYLIIEFISTNYHLYLISKNLRVQIPITEI